MSEEFTEDFFILPTHRIEQLLQELHAGSTLSAKVTRAVISGPGGYVRYCVFEFVRLLMCVWA